MARTFPTDAFRGTAEYYLRYRPPFPPELIDDLRARAGAARPSRLLDLACGPGRVTFALAAHFDRVDAVDLEPEMIAVARREAARLERNNIGWSVGRAEEFAAPDASFDLITIGDAFHRLDQPRVSELTLAWLKPRGAIAILGSHDTLSRMEAWHGVVRSVAEKWTQRPIVYIPANETGPEHCESVLRAAGFDEVGSFEFCSPLVWAIEDIAGNLYSTSYASKGALGTNAEAFAAELTDALLAFDPAGRFRETARFGYTFGRKRG